MTIASRNRKASARILDWFSLPIPTEPPSAWVERNVVFNEPEVKGPFDFVGREYLRQWIDDAQDPNVHDQTICSGTGAGKTISFMARTAWQMELDPARGLWVMPATEGAGGARNFSKSRLIPMLKACACFSSKIPTGVNRFDLASLHIEMAGNVIDFVGSNSPGQIGSNRCRWVQQDEKDKFAPTLKQEAGAGYLANERTKGVAGAKRYGTSTPSVEDGPIWQDLMASDLRRRFVSCPLCGIHHPSSRRFVLVRSNQFTVLPVKMANGDPIPLAQMEWDKEARLNNGLWDMQRVIQSVRFVCPYCRGHIRDEHRVQMDKSGVWQATKHGSPYHAGYHLPSFYTAWKDFDSSFGGMAKKFLDAHESSAGMRGYINSELAEVDISQEHGSRIEMESDSFAQTDWTALMTVDFQKLWPYLWFVVQKWSSFKLQPPFKLIDGKPEFSDKLGGNPHLKRCLDVLACHIDAWVALSELLRYTSRSDDQWPMLDFLIAKGITGKKLVELYEVTCGRNTLDLGRWIFREMGKPMPKGGDSEIVAAGYCEMSGDDAWMELREIQQQFEVGKAFKFWGINPNRAVLIDSGYAEEHNPEVLRKCFESGTSGKVEWYDPASKKFSPFRLHANCRPVLIEGWIPFKGYPIAKRWRVGGIESETHWAADDPFKGSAESDKFVVKVLESASEIYFHRWMDSRDRQKEIRRAIALRESYRGNLWSIAGNVQLFPKKRFSIEQFHQQINSKGRDSNGEIWERGKGGSGKKRHPDHLNDCCRNMYPLAEVHGFFSYEPKDNK